MPIERTEKPPVITLKPFHLFPGVEEDFLMMTH